jgi:Mn-dependent DtxR family transcriptional regulator
VAFQLEADADTLLAEYERNERRMTDLQRRQADLKARIDAQMAKQRAEQPERARRPSLSDEAIRDAIVDMGTFTKRELAARLGVKPPTAQRYIEEWLEDGRLGVEGKWGKERVYGYVPPAGPGKAFEVQQKLRLVEGPTRTYGGPVAGTGKKGQLYEQVADPSVRAAVREAMGEGYTLERKGDGHFTLVRGVSRITVPSTPLSGDGAAKRIRAQMGQKRARQVVRSERIAAART